MICGSGPHTRLSLTPLGPLPDTATNYNLQLPPVYAKIDFVSDPNTRLGCPACAALSIRSLWSPTLNSPTFLQSFRAAWCVTNTDTCNTLCDQKVSSNSCNSDTLIWGCVCLSGLEPNLTIYLNTVPSFTCNQWRSDCIAGVPNDVAAQEQCKADAECGVLEAQALEPSESSLKPWVSPSSVMSATSSHNSSPTLTTSSSIRSDTSSDATRSEASSTTSSTGTSSTDSSTISQNTGGSTQTGNPTGHKSSASKAGIAVGIILGLLTIVLVIFFLRRRAKKRKGLKGGEPREPYHPSDEKQVAIPVASEISQKPELHGEPGIAGSDMPQVVDYNSISPNRYPNPTQWQQYPQYQTAPSEVYSSNSYPTELHGGESVNPAELHSVPRSQEMEASAVSYPPPPTPTQSAAQTVNDSAPLAALAVPNPPQSPAPTTRSVQPLSAEEIEGLEEEERRIDAEMAEAQRMKELREQKFAIQQRLKDAKRSQHYPNEHG